MTVRVDCGRSDQRVNERRDDRLDVRLGVAGSELTVGVLGTAPAVRDDERRFGTLMASMSKESAYNKV